VLTAREAYALLGNEPLWQAASICHQILAVAKIPHAFMGGVAVCLHGYQRNTIDVDFLVRNEDLDAIRQHLESENYIVGRKGTAFRSPSGIAMKVLVAGDRAGSDSKVKLPDPAGKGTTIAIDDVPVLRLSKLIESKIACGLGNLRRTYKDFADVVELIVVNKLNSSFARYLHKSLRATYRELVRRSRGKA
jgi:hypothetical protein